MIAEPIGIVALRREAVGIDDLAADAAVAAAPMPRERAGSMARSLDRGQDRVAQPHLLAVMDDVVDMHARKRLVDALLRVVGAGEAAFEDLGRTGRCIDL